MARSEARRLHRIAGHLQRRRSGPPSLFAFTDPQRTPDLDALVARLPRGAALIYRHFGGPDALATARRLRVLTRRRGVLLLIGADLALAKSVRADGVHLPERMRGGRRSACCSTWIVTMAAHSEHAAHRAASAGADAVVLSAVFPSRSPSAGRPLGVIRLAATTRRVGAPVIALGGVNTRTAARLIGTNVAGVAAVEGLTN